VQDGLVYEETATGVNTFPAKNIVSLERVTSDPTELQIMSDDIFTYSFPDSASRQQFYQALLCSNPFGTASGTCETRDVNVIMMTINADSEPPADEGFWNTDGSWPQGYDVYACKINGPHKEAWGEAIKAALSETCDAREELSAIDIDQMIGHDLRCYVSYSCTKLISNCMSSQIQEAETNSSSAVTFWIGETSYCVYASSESEYEDCYIGSWQLDLHQCRHILGIGPTVHEAVPLSGGELSQGTCGSEGEFLWRSSPGQFEGPATPGKTSPVMAGIETMVINAPAVVPAVRSQGASNVVLVVDNLRAMDLADESIEAQAYVYIGAQFCEDRRTSAKTGTANPVWAFDKKVAGMSQSTSEVLQMPTHGADIEYLQAQRLMVAVMDDSKGEDDPIIGYGFLPLQQCLSELDTAIEFNIDLTFFMQSNCTLTGRISAHAMNSMDDVSKSKSKSSGDADTTKADSSAAGGLKGNPTENAKIISQYFRRYDLDLSGTINSQDELQQLCTNLCVRIELPFGVDHIDSKVNSAGNMAELEWTVVQFAEWFGTEFEVNLEGVSF